MRPVPKPAAKADALPELYKSVRDRTVELCEPLEIEDYIPQPVIDVSPPKWNIAHTTWFFEEMILKKFVPGYEVFDPDFGFLFNSYYNSIGERTARDHRGDLSRPTVKKVFAYREYVDEKMLELLAANDSDELRELVVLGCNHEQQHQELFLTDLKYTFSVNPLFPVYREGYVPEEHPDTGSPNFIDVPGSIYRIGCDGDSFCFDNELARHEVLLRDFSIADRLV
ncbi:MAG TPA: DinB family protein, partial [Pyrinomonadaceae bacterium]|nr:DinB family protein [Pyrinomonadaceae bacterium]